MGKQTVGSSAGPPKRAKAKSPTATKNCRGDHIKVFLDHCIAAKKVADDRNEKFLSYMLSMTIEEARASID